MCPEHSFKWPLSRVHVVCELRGSQQHHLVSTEESQKLPLRNHKQQPVMLMSTSLLSYIHIHPREKKKKKSWVGLSKKKKKKCTYTHISHDMHTLKRTSSLKSVNAGNRWFGRRQGAKRVGWGVQHSSVLSASATLESGDRCSTPALCDVCLPSIVGEGASPTAPPAPWQKGYDAASIRARLSKTRAR